jgi:hypothetical protein
MKRNVYVDRSVDYFRGKISLEQLSGELEREVPLIITGSIPQGEPVMVIVNHPRLRPELHLPCERIAGFKGGNTHGYVEFHFPIVRQLVLHKLLGGRRSFTIARDIGWDVAMQEMGHLLINGNKGMADHIISRLRGSGASVVIFPEGGIFELEVFRTGFLYIACELGIRYLVTGVFTPFLSLNGENAFHVISVEDIGSLASSFNSFAAKQRTVIADALQKNGWSNIT